MPRLLADLKTDCHGHITGRLDTPSDSAFALEAIALIIEQLSKSCGVPAREICDDLKGLCNVQ